MYQLINFKNNIYKPYLMTVDVLPNKIKDF